MSLCHLSEITSRSNSETYDNFLQGVLFTKCPSGHVLSDITSSPYSASHTDRQWRIGCRPYPTLGSCSWSSFVGSNGLDFNFVCPATHVVRGVYNMYQPAYQSRKWSFECCQSANMVNIDCQNHTRVNYWNEGFHWSVPGGSYLSGFSTGLRSSEGDFRWSYMYCRAVKNDLLESSPILAANRDQQDSLTHGDVPKQRRRSSAVCNYCKWPVYNGAVQVSFSISADFSESEVATVTSAMRALSQSTCVAFVPHTHQYSHLVIVKEPGCWSYVGRQGGEQKLSLGHGCLYHGIIQHELMHALNFWHEQSRSDRDQWVHINQENIRPGFEHNFFKFDTENLGVDYDYYSLMHYGLKDFSSNGQNTITPVVKSASPGQRFGMTDSDLLKINKLYGCSAFLPKHGEWDNELGQVLSRTCAPGHAVSHIKSSGQTSGDRLWRLSCRSFLNHKNSLCQWSAFLNNHQTAIDFTCPDNKVISGMYAQPSSVQKDRRWKVQCCSALDFVSYDCRTTSYVNYWNKAFEMPVARGNYLTGVHSSYDSQSQDRRWRFTYCQGGEH
uniref:Metalloendopeptidase n=1 Tax=Knipowitschia caucasica TaxID=637954 RepID=A0AAV2M6M4_KNICA